MANKTLKDLYIDELKDLYDAETRLVKALPGMALAAQTEELREGIQGHLEQTKGHAQRLQQILSALGEKSTGKKCAGMVGIIDEGKEIIDEVYADGVADAAIISAAQRVEHYEIGAYGCVRSWAGILGETEAQSLLDTTLQEEKEMDAALSGLAEGINQQATEATSSESEEEDEPRPRARRKSA
jgi:ferritin-like metal-binding protein YciE